MKKFNLILVSTLLVAVVALSQCSTTEKNVTINPPLKGVDVAFNNFTIDPATGGEFTLETGTKISVPANAFVDAEGNAITEPVELKYREFHNPTDVIASGIPMQFKNDGKTENFQSAGMFEMGAVAGDKEVFVKDDKNITVDMASYTDGEGYGMYYFDEATNEWKDIGPTNVRENEAKKEEVEKLGDKPLKPIVPVAAKKSDALINLQLDYHRYPEFKMFRDVLWKYAGTDPERDPANNEALQRTNWKNVKLSQDEGNENVYKLSLTAGGQDFETEVIPVISSGNIADFKAKFAAKLEEYKDLIELREKEQERLQMQADLVRTFSVNKMGLYNCDRFYNDPAVVTFNALFEFDEDVLTNDMTIFLLPKGENAVIQYYGHGAWQNFKMNIEKANVIMAVLPGNKIAVCKPDIARKTLPGNGKGRPDYTFEMKTKQEKIADMSDLEEIMAGL